MHFLCRVFFFECPCCVPPWWSRGGWLAGPRFLSGFPTQPWPCPGEDRGGVSAVPDREGLCGVPGAHRAGGAGRPGGGVRACATTRPAESATARFASVPCSLSACRLGRFWQQLKVFRCPLLPGGLPLSGGRHSLEQVPTLKVPTSNCCLLSSQTVRPETVIWQFARIGWWVLFLPCFHSTIARTQRLN